MSTTFSNNEIEFFKTLNSFKLRIDGRKQFEQRQLEITTDIYPSCYSSIEIKHDEINLILALKGEIVDNQSDVGFVLNYETSNTSSNNNYTNSNNIIASNENKELIYILNKFLIGKIPKESLYITNDNSNNDSKFTFGWKLYIDIFSYSTIDISLLSVLSNGIKVLLTNAKLPKIKTFTNKVTNKDEYDLIEKFEIGIKEKDKYTTLLTHIDNIPYIYLFGVFKDVVYLDPGTSENSIIESYIIMVVKDNKVDYLQAIGSNIDINKLDDLNNFVKMTNNKN